MATYYALESYNVKTNKTNADSLAEDIVSDVLNNELGYLDDDESYFLQKYLPVFSEDDAGCDNYNDTRKKYGVIAKNLVKPLKNTVDKYRKILDEQTNESDSFSPNKHFDNVIIFTVAYALYS